MKSNHGRVRAQGDQRRGRIVDRVADGTKANRTPSRELDRIDVQQQLALLLARRAEDGHPREVAEVSP
jgi:hypothetical protein